jgi:hypothetical protein
LKVLLLTKKIAQSLFSSKIGKDNNAGAKVSNSTAQQIVCKIKNNKKIAPCRWLVSATTRGDEK